MVDFDVLIDRELSLKPVSSEVCGYGNHLRNSWAEFVRSQLLAELQLDTAHSQQGEWWSSSPNITLTMKIHNISKVRVLTVKLSEQGICKLIIRIRRGKLSCWKALYKYKFVLYWWIDSWYFLFKLSSVQREESEVGRSIYT